MPPCQDRGPFSVPSLTISCKWPSTPWPAVLWRSRPSNALVSCCFFMSSPPWETRKRLRRSVCPLDRYNVGEVAGSPVIFPSKIVPVAAERPLFPPLDQALFQAMACEVVAQTKEPLSRQSLADLVRRAQTASGKKISRTTVWRVARSGDQALAIRALDFSAGPSVRREGRADLGPVCRKVGRKTAKSLSENSPLADVSPCQQRIYFN